jgi:hypothetical protein
VKKIRLKKERSLFFIFQFITLPGTDEKLRLIPVVSTILKLSPEEVSGLQQSIQGTIEF